MNPLSIRARVAAVLVFTAVAITPAVIAIDRAFGRDVLLVAPHDQAILNLNRSLHVAGDPVAEIYGNPLSRTVRVVLVTDRNLIRPAEDRSLVLLPVGDAGSRPLQVQTLFFVARYTILILAVLSLLIAFFPIRRVAMQRLSKKAQEKR